MTPAEFDLYAKLVREKSGLVLTPEKTYLLESRLMPIARRLNLKDLSELAGRLRQAGDKTLPDQVVEAMTTNESFFFRDGTPFEQFRQIVLPKLLTARAATKTLRIWCAAASTGQEPYTIALILKEEAAKLAGWRTSILGTDISRDVLRRAGAGIYTQFEVQRGLPIQLLVKHFTQVEGGWQISQAIRSMVEYRYLNLLENFTTLGQFDIIFCRNVLIYFDPATKRGVLERMSRMLAPDGQLYLGGAETVVGITECFQPVAGQRGSYSVVAKAAAGAATKPTVAVAR
ncbi:MAG: protein-glutamate O-methyltransferase [Alphaproteobacteria bacterium]